MKEEGVGRGFGETSCDCGGKGEDFPSLTVRDWICPLLHHVDSFRNEFSSRENAYAKAPRPICGASGKESACQSRRHKRGGFDPWVRKIPCWRKWQPTPVFLPGKSHGQRSLAGYSPPSKESDTTERLSKKKNIYIYIYI